MASLGDIQNFMLDGRRRQLHVQSHQICRIQLQPKSAVRPLSTQPGHSPETMHAGGATDARRGRHDAGPAGQARGAAPAQRRHGAAARVCEVRGSGGHGVQAGAEAPRVGFNTAAKCKRPVNTAQRKDLLRVALLSSGADRQRSRTNCRWRETCTEMLQ